MPDISGVHHVRVHGDRRRAQRRLVHGPAGDAGAALQRRGGRGRSRAGRADFRGRSCPPPVPERLRGPRSTSSGPVSTTWPSPSPAGRSWRSGRASWTPGGSRSRRSPRPRWARWSSSGIPTASNSSSGTRRSEHRAAHGSMIVTFLFTDLVGSTRQWEEHPEVMAAAVARHDGIVRKAVEGGGGRVFSTGGDASCAASTDRRSRSGPRWRSSGAWPGRRGPSRSRWRSGSGCARGRRRLGTATRSDRR